MKKNKLSIRIKKSGAGIVAGIALCFFMIIFAPFEEYISNIGELRYDIYDLLKMIVPIFFGSIIIISFVFCIINKISFKLYSIVVAAFFAITLALYIQGNFLSTVLPPLDGSEINWSDYDNQRIPSLILWSLSLIACITLSLTLKEKFLSVIKSISYAFIALLIVTSSILSFSSNVFDKKANCVVTTKSLTTMSSSKNFIILILDAVNSETMYDQIQSNDNYKDIFKDFTFYKNTVGAYTYTTHNIPFILSGKWFENEEYTYQYLSEAYSSSTFLSSLEDQNYSVGIYDEEVPLNANSLDRFENICENSSNRFDLPRDFYVFQLKLVGLKYFPYSLKKYCTFTSYYANNASRKVLESDSLFTSSNLEFFNSFSNADISTTDKNCFKLIHIEGAHVPFQYDKDLNIVDNSDYEQSVECCFKLTETYLDTLKRNDVYDNSIIIVMADHGFNGDWTYGRQNPILFIKGINETHDFQISESPVSFEDLLPAYQLLLSGNSSTNLFPYSENDIRSRRYMFYYYNEENTIWEYEQTGYASDLDAMKETGNIYTHAMR